MWIVCLNVLADPPPLPPPKKKKTKKELIYSNYGLKCLIFELK